MEQRITVVQSQSLDRGVDIQPLDAHPQYIHTSLELPTPPSKFNKMINEQVRARGCLVLICLYVDATSLRRKPLINVQEALIDQLTARGLPPTSHIVKNLAEEIIRRGVDRALSS